MRELVDINFVDNTIYTPQEGEDVVAIAIAHYWGPVDKIQRVTLSTIESIFPKTILSKSYLKAYWALKYGVPSLEVVRPKGTSKYLYLEESEPTAYLLAAAEAQEILGGYLIQSKYPGYAPLLYEGLLSGKSISIVVTFKEVGVDVDGRSVTIQTKIGTTVLETIEGSVVPEHETDGVQDYITDLMSSKSEYWNAAFDPEYVAPTFNQVGGAADFTSVTTPANISFAAFDEDSVTEEDFISVYETIFNSTDASLATILVTPYSSKNLNDTILAVAEARSNCLALVGYPTGNPFDKDSIETFFNSLTKTKFGITCAGRAVDSYMGRKFVHDAIAPAVGRYAIVRKDAGPNQMPSASSYGSFPSVLSATLTFQEVLDLHDNSSINSVYTSSNGPQMFGIRTLHTRKGSYYALSNVMRIVALLIQSSLVTADSVIHTPNNPTTRAAVQLDRQSYLDNLIGAEQIRPESLAICSDTNNTDAATEGGKWLVIDFDIWFYKLVERVRIRIKASDTTTSVTIG